MKQYLNKTSAQEVFFLFREHLKNFKTVIYIPEILYFPWLLHNFNLTIEVYLLTG